MDKQVNSAFSAEVKTDISREDLKSVMTALEPDQIIFTKEQHHCPRRRLSPTEMVLFWALRLYLVFMVGVVAYQIWTGAR
jgi:hypothetical protein